MEKDEKYKRTLEQFEKSFEKFQEIIQQPQLFNFLSKELIIEVATKRFEYVYESCWKTLKEYLRMQGVICSTPLQCFKEAYKAGLIPQEFEQLFYEIVEKRNLIVHIYSFDKAKEIFKFITNQQVYLGFKTILEKLKNL